jgi:hypothetical protein
VKLFTNFQKNEFFYSKIWIFEKFKNLEKSWNLDIQKNESKKMEIQKFGKSKKLNFDAASGGAASRPATYIIRERGSPANASGFRARAYARLCCPGDVNRAKPTPARLHRGRQPRRPAGDVFMLEHHIQLHQRSLAGTGEVGRRRRAPPCDVFIKLLAGSYACAHVRRRRLWASRNFLAACDLFMIIVGQVTLASQLGLR